MLSLDVLGRMVLGLNVLGVKVLGVCTVVFDLMSHDLGGCSWLGSGDSVVSVTQRLRLIFWKRWQAVISVRLCSRLVLQLPLLLLKLVVPLALSSEMGTLSNDSLRPTFFNYHTIVIEIVNSSIV